MTAIWRNDGTGWSLLAPVGFSQEAALHDLIEQAPQLLPLAGAPRLTIVGREAPLGNGYADLFAVEPDGRLAVIEVKLARNAEARRAVVSQVLAYAAYLHGQDSAVVERDAVDRYLSQRGYQTLAAAVAAGDQEHSFDPDAFAAGLTESLAEGRFRLVFVLDEAPDELVRLVGYLETVTDRLLIDLVTVSAYDVGGSQILVPQRVEPERRSTETRPSPVLQQPSPGRLVAGSDDFAAEIDRAPEEERPLLRKLRAWADALAEAGLVNLFTSHGKEAVALLPWLPAEHAGLASVYLNPGGKVTMQLWRSVFERRAPEALSVIGQQMTVGQGNSVPRDKLNDDAFLQELTTAYQEAAMGRAQHSHA